MVRFLVDKLSYIYELTLEWVLGATAHKCITEELGGAFYHFPLSQLPQIRAKQYFFIFFNSISSVSSGYNKYETKRERNTCLPKFEAIEGETRQ